MNAILSSVLVFGLCSFAGAPDTKANPVGTWKCEYEIGGEKRESTLVIKKEGDKLTGTMSYPDKQVATLKDLTSKEAELTFSLEREFMDNKFKIDYKLKVEGNKVKGKAATEFGGDKVEFDIEGKREKTDK